MFEIGRLAVKIAGRDAGKKCVIVDVLEGNRVLIDGETRRKKCNPKHLEPLQQVISIQKGMSHEDIKEELKKIGIEIKDTKPKETPQRAVKERKQKKTEETKKVEAVKQKAEKKSKPKKEEKEDSK